MKIVFCDRDGVINRDSADYIKNWSEFEFLPGSLEALALLKSAGFQVLVVTNQSIIGRGMATPEILADTHARMSEAVRKAGGEILDILHCPHVPEDGCPCRKPRPGMLLAARDRHGIDLSRAVMIGDSVKDMDAASRAGLGQAFLVRTGNGGAAPASARKKGVRVDRVFDDLLAAARFLVKGDG